MTANIALVRDAAILESQRSLPPVEACAIPGNPAATNAMESIAQVLNTRFGANAPLAERAVTWGDLYARGIVGLQGNDGNIIRNPTPPGGVIPLPPPPEPDDPANDPLPPAPTGLSATAALANIILDWDDPDLTYVAHTEIWRNTTDNLATAVRIGMTPGTVYADALGTTGVTHYYWIRHVNRKDEPGPFNSSSGTSATTGKVGTADLTDAIITAAKIASGAINFNVIAGQIIGSQVSSGAIGSTHLTSELDARIANAGSGDTTAPGAPTSLSATGGIQTIVVSWVNPSDGDLAKIEVWRHSSNDRDSATLRGEARGTVFVDPVASGSTYYYWVRAVDISGNIGSYNAGVNAGVSGTTGTIDTPDIGDDTITNAKILNLSAAKITTGTLDAARIGAASITSDKLAAGSVVAGKIQTGALVAGDGVISNAYITAAMLQTAIIGSAAIANAAVTNAAIANLAVDSAKIADAAIVTAKIGDAQVSTAKIQDAAITTAKIGDAQITTAKIGAAAVATANIGDAQVTNAKIFDLNASKITAGTIDADRIRVGMAGGSNLLPNSAFRNTYVAASGPLPYGWAIYNNAAAPVTSDVIAGGLFNTRFTRVTVGGSGTTLQLGIYSRSDVSGGVKSWVPGLSYVVSLWARAAGAGAAGQRMWGLYSNMGFSSATSLENPQLINGTWQRYSWRCVPQDNAYTDAGELFISWDVTGTLAAGSAIDICAPQVELGEMPTNWGPNPNYEGEITEVLIADGSITAPKISVTDLSAINANMGTITAGLLRNSTNTTQIDMNATFGSLFLRAGVPTNYGYLHGTRSPVEIYANGAGFFGREVVSGARPKSNGIYSIPSADRPTLAFSDAPPPPAGGA